MKQIRVWRSLVSRLNGVQEAAGSNPVTRTTSEQAVYRLLRLFLKVRARSRRCSSFPNRNRLRWVTIWVRRCAAVFSYRKEISILTAPSTSEQSPLCSDVFLCLRQKRRHPPAPLLLLSNCDPLRWARSWWAALRAAFFSTKMSILSVPAQKT